MRLVPFALLFTTVWLAACGESYSPPQLLRTQAGEFDPLAEAPPVLAGDPGPEERTSYLVQFVGPIMPGWLEEVVATGVTARGYFPDDAWLVAGTAAQARAVAALSTVRAVILAPIALSIDPALLVERDDGTVAVRADVGHLTLEVEVAEPAAVDEIIAVLASLGAPVFDAIGVVITTRLGPAAVVALAAHAEVMGVAPALPVKTLNDREYGYVQGNGPHQSPIWGAGLRGGGQIVGILDNGLSTGSCRFGGNKVVMLDRETYSGTPTPKVTEHGTHVAGIAVGDLNNDGVYQSEDGEAPGARLYFSAVGDPNDVDGENLLIPADLTALFQGAYTAGARIHSNSWGAASGGYSAQVRSLDAFVAAHPDFTVFAAAGNDGPEIGTARRPGTAKNVVTVASLDAGAPETVSVYSSHGPTNDNRIKPTIVAPGENVVSADYASVCGTLTLSGTSMATPAAAGAGAMVRQYYAAGYYPTGAAVAANALSPSAALVRATLIASTHDMQGDRTDGHFPSSGQGFGRLDLSRALRLGTDAEALFVNDATAGLAQGQSYRAQFALLGGSRLRAVLTWTDPPATAGTSLALVNDLDLVISGPGGTYAGNALAGGQATPNGAPDRVNVEEFVNLDAAPAGSYEVMVAAHNVPTGNQAFALVIVGDFAARPDAGSAVAGAEAGRASAPAGFGGPMTGIGKVGTQSLGQGDGGYVSAAAGGCAGGGSAQSLVVALAAAFAAARACGRPRRSHRAAAVGPHGSAVGPRYGCADPITRSRPRP